MKISLRIKILGIVLLPALLIGFTAIFISRAKVTEVMDGEMMNHLKISAYTGREFYETLNNGEFVREQDGTVKKGDFVITGNFSMVDVIREGGNVYATFFYGDERIVTNVLDENGQRMIGTKASDTVIQVVLKEGKEYFSNNVLIGTERYYGYYVPVRQSGTGDVIGMFFTGDNISKIEQAASSVSNTITYLITVILLASVLIAFLILMGMTNALKRTVTSLHKLSEGVLNTQEVQRDLKRRDEIGDIVRATEKLRDTLLRLIGNINKTASNLFDSSKGIENVVIMTTQNSVDINKSTDTLLETAIQQSVSVNGVSDQVNYIGTSIHGTMDSINELTKSAEIIGGCSKSTISVLDSLDYENKEVIKSIEQVYEQTNATHEYVKKIEAVMNMIQDVTDETNMLSLNASIEAARAGEAGRGFAIVAEQVKKLAEESSRSTVQIEGIIKNLNDNSTAAVNAMSQVKNIIEAQSSKISDTMNSYQMVNQNIETTANGVLQVSGMMKAIDKARSEVIDLVSELSSISEENETSTRTTSDAANDLANSMNIMEEEIKRLRSLAENLSHDVKLFKL